MIHLVAIHICIMLYVYYMVNAYVVNSAINIIIYCIKIPSHVSFFAIKQKCTA